MTELHARIDLLEGALQAQLPGASGGTSKRAFAVLRLMRNDGTTGLGEASPLPGYSPDRMEDALEDLRRLADGPVSVDALDGPREVLRQAFSALPMRHSASRFAFETALLDWLGKTRCKPVHRLLGAETHPRGVPIADLVWGSSIAEWPARVDALVDEGATHLKLKVGADLGNEVATLQTIRRDHPTLAIRLDGNRRVSAEALRQHAALLEALELELFEEPVPPEQWPDAVDLPLPYALDETLRDRSLAEHVLQSGRIRAVVLKPTVLGGFTGVFELAELAAVYGAKPVVSHTFDGPIARAAAAELALVLGGEPAAGLGAHPALELWPPYRIAAISGRRIVPHEAHGLGLWLDGESNA